MPKITELYAFVMADEDDEGILGNKLGDSWMPFIGADLNRIHDLIPYADEICKHTGKPYKILHFKLEGEIKVEK